MRRTSLNGTKVSEGYSLLLLTSMFIIGMIYGVLLLQVEDSSLSNTIAVLTSQYQAKLTHQNLFLSFFSSFMSIFLFILLPYLLGFSAIAQPLILFIPCFKGVGLGFFMSSLYLSYGLRGVMFCVLNIIPATLIGLFCLIVSCREALKLSNLFFLCFASRHNITVNITTIKLYTLKLAVLTGISLSAAVVDIICSLLFSKMFVF